ncbi:hypothetical protein [Alsobacter sp. R-9]
MPVKTGLRVAAVAAGCLWGSQAFAQAQADSLTMTCAQAKALVNQRGSLILGTGPYVFDRYVRDGSFCKFPMKAEESYVKTKDTSYCLAGYVCSNSRTYN